MPRWIWAALGIPLAVVSILFVDQPLAQWLATHAQNPLVLGGRAITDVGLGEHWFALAIIGFIVGRWVFRRHELAQWGAHQFWALVIAGISVQFLKHVFGRQRPHLSDTFESRVFQPMNFDWHFHSLPSGHTQVLFTVATVTALWLPRGWRWSLFVAMFALSFTRVLADQHFLGDVIAGALTGYYGSWLSLKLWEKKIPRPD